ncbi:unnamed protein product, partial [Amoebophrya sp. A25]
LPIEDEDRKSSASTLRGHAEQELKTKKTLSQPPCYPLVERLLPIEDEDRKRGAPILRGHLEQKLSLPLQIVDEANKLEHEALTASCECDEDLNITPSYADIVRRRPRRLSERPSKQCFTSIFNANPSGLLAASQGRPSPQSCKNEADYHPPFYSKNAFPTPSLSLVSSKSNTNRTSANITTSTRPPRTSPVYRLSPGTKTTASTSDTASITATHQCKESHQSHLLLSTSTPASSSSDDTKPAEPEHEYAYKVVEDADYDCRTCDSSSTSSAARVAADSIEDNILNLEHLSLLLQEEIARPGAFERSGLVLEGEAWRSLVQKEREDQDIALKIVNPPRSRLMKQELPSSLDRVPAVSSTTSLMRETCCNRFRALFSTMAISPDDGEDENKTNEETSSAVCCLTTITSSQLTTEKQQTKASKKKQMLSKRRLDTSRRSLLSGTTLPTPTEAAISSLRSACHDDAPSSSSRNGTGLVDEQTDYAESSSFAPPAPPSSSAGASTCFRERGASRCETVVASVAPRWVVNAGATVTAHSSYRTNLRKRILSAGTTVAHFFYNTRKGIADAGAPGARSISWHSCRTRRKQLPKKRLPPLRLLQQEEHETKLKVAVLRGACGLLRHLPLLLLPALAVVAYQQAERQPKSFRGEPSQERMKQHARELFDRVKTHPRFFGQHFLRLEIPPAALLEWQADFRKWMTNHPNQNEELQKEMQMSAQEAVRSCMHDLKEIPATSTTAGETQSEAARELIEMEKELWPDNVLGVGGSAVVVKTSRLSDKAKAVKYVRLSAYREDWDDEPSAGVCVADRLQQMREGCTALLVSNYPPSTRQIAAQTLEAYVTKEILVDQVSWQWRQKSEKDLRLYSTDSLMLQQVYTFGDLEQLSTPRPPSDTAVETDAQEGHLGLIRLLLDFIKKVDFFHKTTGMAHQDLTPSNVFLVKNVDHGTLSPLLTDFGESAEAGSVGVWGKYCTVPAYADPLYCSYLEGSSVVVNTQDKVSIDSDAWTVGAGILRAMGANVHSMSPTVSTIIREISSSRSPDTTPPPYKVCVEVMNTVILPVLRKLPEQFLPAHQENAKELALGLRKFALNCNEKESNTKWKPVTPLHEQIEKLDNEEDNIVGERSLALLREAFQKVEERQFAATLKRPEAGSLPIPNLGPRDRRAAAFLAVEDLWPNHGDNIHHDDAFTHDMDRDALHGGVGIHGADNAFDHVGGSKSRRVAPASDDDWLSTTDEMEMEDEPVLVRYDRSRGGQETSGGTGGG